MCGVDIGNCGFSSLMSGLVLGESTVRETSLRLWRGPLCRGDWREACLPTHSPALLFRRHIPCAPSGGRHPFWAGVGAQGASYALGNRSFPVFLLQYCSDEALYPQTLLLPLN